MRSAGWIWKTDAKWDVAVALKEIGKGHRKNRG